MNEKLAKLIEKAESQIREVGSEVDSELVSEIAGRFSMMLDNKDAMLVSGSDPSELETVRRNFVEKKLGITDKEKGAAIVSKIADKMSGIKMKNRVAFYYLIQKEVG
jgi:fructose-1-phosphate kinase PfkB-like protein